jgi:acyl-CoA thioester hydrolase
METMQMTSTKEVQIRFNEVDSLSIVWHGNYVKYLEDGREDFGKKFGIGYLQVKKAGYIIPIVDLKIQYKKSLYYGDSVLVETTFVETDAAKMFFKYRLLSPETKEVLCTASTTQVFLDKKGTLQLTLPDFFQNWKKRWFA